MSQQQGFKLLGIVLLRRSKQAVISANFSALRPNDGYQKFGPSLGSEIRLSP